MRIKSKKGVRSVTMEVAEIRALHKAADILCEAGELSSDEAWKELGTSLRLAAGSMEHKSARDNPPPVAEAAGDPEGDFNGTVRDVPEPTAKKGKSKK